MKSLLDDEGDVAIVVGGYNSSNTSHLAELCEGRVPVFYVKDDEEILSVDEIKHLVLPEKKITVSRDWLPKCKNAPVRVLISAGASCPDATVERVIEKIATFFTPERGLQDSV
jgi:4-hydroxy-3-methylbut-2-enyl diphosphate reductase